jgi:CDP-diacylglycerol--serine O-phosphatidyltransferase
MRLRIKRIRGGKWFRERGQKGLSMIPHLFTLANLVFGVLSIVKTMEGDLFTAALLVGGSVLADALDGRAARLLRADGDFGKQLDSLADIVSFGVAPALIMYQANLKALGIVGFLIASLFPMAGALRLARFNIIKTSGFFIGLPITVAGGIVATFVLYGRGLESSIVPYALAAIAFLMVSTIHYPDFKKTKLSKIRVLPLILPAVLTVIILHQDPRTIIVLPLSLYAISGVLLHLAKSWRESIAPWLRALALRGR